MINPNLARSQKGFTLLEILVVFSLITLITGVSFVTFSSYSKRQAIDQVAGEVKQAFDTARLNAVSQVKPASGCDSLSGYRVNLTSNSYTVVPICTSATPPTGTTTNLPNAVTITNFAACSGTTYNTLSHTVTAPTGGFGCEFRIQTTPDNFKSLIIQDDGGVFIQP